MLLNEELIEKLMRNKTLVSLMSGQLKRVIPTEKLGDLEKERIVRQVFVQMMDKKVDFSMNNVRLAVKTVSSSYRAAAEKSHKLKRTGNSETSLSTESRTKTMSSEGNTSGGQRRRNVDPKGPFGRRATTSSSLNSDSTTTTKTFSSRSSLPVIDTALKLTAKGSISRRQLATGGSLSSNSGTSDRQQTDSSGNPIVVVLLPTEKAK